MAEGMRSTSARDAFSFGYFSLGMQRKVTRPTGRNKILSHAINISANTTTNSLEFNAVILQTTGFAFDIHARATASIIVLMWIQPDE
jgi:hypothetical protein